MIMPNVTDGESTWARQLRKIWTTRGSRLEAYRRLGRTGGASRWVITIASVLLVGLALAVAFGLVGATQNGRAVVDFLSAVGAVIILVVSAMEHGKSYELRAERHHRAALALGRLYDEARSAPPEGRNLKKLIEAYNVILEQSGDNHEPIDYEMFAVRHPRDFKCDRLDKVRARMLWHAASQRPWLVIVAILCSAFLLLEVAVP